MLVISMELLIIDDNQDITNMFSKYFKLKNHHTSVVNSGENGLQMIETQKFDVILLDLAMPNFSGRDIVDHLYKNNKINSHKIVVLTASSVSDDDKTYLQNKGVHSILRKPIDPDELLNYVEKINSHG